MSRKTETTGKERFYSYYSELYGSRWDSLQKALLKKSETELLDLNLTEPYYMDKASMIAANLLPVKPGDRVLDMCAAPGGKTLILASKLKGTGLLVSNDRSSQRRNRLINVINGCLPEEFRKNISVKGYDSSKWSLYEKDAYDCILLDAPCSSERHVMADESALSQWSQNRPKMLSVQQYTMLCAALDAVVPGGYILYSTCSINQLENEKLIERLKAKKGSRFEEVTPCADYSESLSCGRIILPDSGNGHGPLYFCLLRRIS